MACIQKEAGITPTNQVEADIYQSVWLSLQLIGNCIGLICKPVLALGPIFLNLTIPDAMMGCGFRALTI
eukprot:scaffold26636_cov44-Attheya_sp.AAC.4